MATGGSERRDSHLVKVSSWGKGDVLGFKWVVHFAHLSRSREHYGRTGQGDPQSQRLGMSAFKKMSSGQDLAAELTMKD